MLASAGETTAGRMGDSARCARARGPAGPCSGRSVDRAWSQREDRQIRHAGDGAPAPRHHHQRAAEEARLERWQEEVGETRGGFATGSPRPPRPDHVEHPCSSASSLIMRWCKACRTVSRRLGELPRSTTAENLAYGDGAGSIQRRNDAWSDEAGNTVNRSIGVLYEQTLMHKQGHHVSQPRPVAETVLI
jgi:hypothetical protein